MSTPLSVLTGRPATAELAILPYDLALATLADARGGSPGTGALLMLCLNDALELQAQIGFEAGAALFRDLGQRVTTALAAQGVVVRLGEATYCVLLRRAFNSGHAVLAAEKILRAAESALSNVGIALGSHINVGIAMLDTENPEIEAGLRKAQLAAAAARRRNARVMPYDDACAEQVLKAGRLGRALVAALETGALTVAYQPKIATATGRVSGVEALMRWHENGATVATPDEFIPLAEQIGLIPEVTWYSLTNALRFSNSAGQLPVAVNVSPRMLHEPEFVEMIETAIRTWAVEPHVLTLELTEGALVADFEQAVHTVSRVRRLGVRIAIDDFGTGYSSLSYFKRIPADELKIDKSFVLRMLDDPADQRLVSAIVALAKQFQFSVVAEGVESRAALDMLAAMGCDTAQGFFFAPALQADRLREWLAARGPGFGPG